MSRDAARHPSLDGSTQVNALPDDQVEVVSVGVIELSDIVERMVQIYAAKNQTELGRIRALVMGSTDIFRALGLPPKLADDLRAHSEALRDLDDGKVAPHLAPEWRGGRGDNTALWELRAWLVAALEISWHLRDRRKGKLLDAARSVVKDLPAAIGALPRKARNQATSEDRLISLRKTIQKETMPHNSQAMTILDENSRRLVDAGKLSGNERLAELQSLYKLASVKTEECRERLPAVERK